MIRIVGVARSIIGRTFCVRIFNRGINIITEDIVSFRSLNRV
jgi:hypothetical protein